MKFMQAMNLLVETTIPTLFNAIKSNNSNIYKDLGIIYDTNDNIYRKKLTYNETKEALSKMGINIELDPKLDANIKAATAQADRSQEAMQQRKGYSIGQERIALAKSKGLL